MLWPWLYESGVALFLTTIEMKNTLILKNNAKWKPYYLKTTTIKTNVAKISAAVLLPFDSVTSSWKEPQPQLKQTLPKFLLQCYFRSTVLQVLEKNVHEKLSNLRTQIKVGRFWNLHSSFSVPEWSTCYFPLLVWVAYQAGKVLKISIIMMSGEALSWSTIKFSKLMVKKIRRS